jgi:hypothetical protein
VPDGAVIVTFSAGAKVTNPELLTVAATGMGLVQVHAGARDDSSGRRLRPN